MDTAMKHPVLDQVKPSFVIFDIRATLTLSPESQSARMSKITIDGLTRSGHLLLPLKLFVYLCLIIAYSFPLYTYPLI